MHDQLWADFKKAGQALDGLGSGQPLNMRNNLEQRYAAAYQRLVRVGEARQLRRKYRGDT